MMLCKVQNLGKCNSSMIVVIVSTIHIDMFTENMLASQFIELGLAYMDSHD